MATAQWGRITTAQLERIGIGESTRGSWLRTGWLIREHRGVFAVGNAAPSMHARFMAAVLAVGADAYLSHISAGLLWRLIRIQEPRQIDVTCPRKLVHRDNITVHWTRNPHHTTRDGIPVATPIQTLLDLGTALRQEWLLRRAASQGLIDGRFDLATLTERLATTPGHRGAARLQRLLPKIRKTRSGLEDKAADIFEEHGLPRPLSNEIIDDRELDLYWPRDRLVVEIDSAAYHDNPFARHADAEKTRFLTARGYRVIRISDVELDADPSACAQRIRAALTLA